MATGLVADKVIGKGWEGAQELDPLPVAQDNQITELDVLEALLQLLKESPELTGYLIGGIDKRMLKRGGDA